MIIVEILERITFCCVGNRTERLRVGSSLGEVNSELGLRRWLARRKVRLRDMD